MEIAVITALILSGIAVILALSYRSRGAPKPPEFIPRTWNIPEAHHAAILKARKAYKAKESDDMALVRYKQELRKAGFDGFGHGHWSFDRQGGFPFGRLVEIDPNATDD